MTTCYHTKGLWERIRFLLQYHSICESWTRSRDRHAHLCISFTESFKAHNLQASLTGRKAITRVSHEQSLTNHEHYHDRQNFEGTNPT